MHCIDGRKALGDRSERVVGSTLYSIGVAVDERERSGIPNLTQQQQQQQRATIHGVTNIKQPWNPLMYYSKQRRDAQARKMK